MYDMDVVCSLKGSTTSTIAQWHDLHTYITYAYGLIHLSQIWGDFCSGIMVGVSGHMPIYNG